MAPDHALHEKELFRRIALDDEKAFEEIFHRFRLQLFHFSLKITKLEDAAEEMVQECFIKLWASRHTLGELENPVGYIYRIAKNASLDYLRRIYLDEQMRSKVKRKMHLAGDSTLEHLNLTETSRLIQLAVTQLPQAQRTVFEMSRLQGKSYQEIAQSLNISVNTVRNHLVRALRTIRTYLESRLNTVFPLILLVQLIENAAMVLDRV